VATNGSVYPKTVAKVVDITSLENMIRTEAFETLEGFMGELKWILHNSVIFDGSMLLTMHDLLYFKVLDKSC